VSVAAFVVSNWPEQRKASKLQTRRNKLWPMFHNYPELE
jgi:hypothetical protein